MLRMSTPVWVFGPMTSDFHCIKQPQVLQRMNFSDLSPHGDSSVVSTPATGRTSASPWSARSTP